MAFEPFKDVYDSLTKPIRGRPVSSLLFFVALLAAGYFGQKHLPIPDQYRSVVQPLLIAIPAAGVVLCLHRLLVMRNDPSRLTDTSVLENIKHSFVGRDDDADDLTALILSPATYQVWLNGDSGVGKSLLLQKAVLPRLAERKVETIYLNSWRGDWQSAPAAAILAQLNDSATGDLFDRLTRVLASPPVHVIILDQFDEFQIEHRDKFIPERGLVIKRDQLEACNRFFSILNAATRRHRVRCVFVSRLDVDWVKRTVLLENEAEEKILTRLQRSVVEGAIAAVVPADKVERPQNGWDDLRQRLCADLAEYGVLPIQMRFAVLGLAELRSHLTVSAYLRIGGVSGLVSRYVEGEVRRVAAGGSMAATLFSLLDWLVTLEGNATAAVTQDELLKPIAEGSRQEVLKALEALKGRDIVRTVSNQDGTLLWRLDHDYLAAPVRAISRRQLPERWEVKDKLQRYEAAAAWQKPLRLADPLTVARLMRARLFKGLRFGPAASWFLFSIAAALVVLAAVTYTVFGGYQWYADNELGRSLFSNFTARSAGLTTTTDSEAKALLHLSTSRFTARQAFLATSLESGENAQRLSAHNFAVAIALSQTNSSSADALYYSTIWPTLHNPQSDLTQFEAALGLIAAWDTASSLNVTAAQQLATALVNRMGQEKDRSALSSLADALGALKDKIDPQIAPKLASTLVERMSNEKDVDALRDLANGLGALKDKIDPHTVQTAATTLVERMGQEKVAAALSSLAEGLGALKAKIDPPTAQKLATTLVERMRQEEAAAALSSLAEGLGALKDKTDPLTLQTAATTLVERMGQEKYLDALYLLAIGLRALKDKIDPLTLQTAATTLVERMSQEKDAYALRYLAKGLGALQDKIDPHTVQTAATTLVEAIEKNPYTLRDLPEELRALKDKIDPPTAQKLATTLVEQMSRWKDATALSYLADGLEALKDKIEPPTIQTAATTLVEHMSLEKNAFALSSLADSLGALQDKVDPQTVQKAAATLVERMSQENDVRALGSLANGLGALKYKFDPRTVQSAAAMLVERMSQEKSASALGSLADGLAALPSANLPQNKLSPISATLQQPNAPCSLLLAFDQATLQSELPKQLRNPLCKEQDWKQLALRATQLSGQPIAQEKEGYSKLDIVVDFPKLSDYVWANEPWYARYQISAPEIAALILLILAAVFFALGLAKSRSLRPPATSS